MVKWIALLASLTASLIVRGLISGNISFSAPSSLMLNVTSAKQLPKSSKKLRELFLVRHGHKM